MSIEESAYTLALMLRAERAEIEWRRTLAWVVPSAPEPAQLTAAHVAQRNGLDS